MPKTARTVPAQNQRAVDASTRICARLCLQAFNPAQNHAVLWGNFHLGVAQESVCETKITTYVSGHFFGSDGLSSTRLSKARRSISRRPITTDATSSGNNFQVLAGSCLPPPRPKPVLTEPGIT